jgi:hypothetical protein
VYSAGAADLGCHADAALVIEQSPVRHVASFIQGIEQVHIHHLMPITAIEPLDVGVLCRFVLLNLPDTAAAQVGSFPSGITRGHEISMYPHLQGDIGVFILHDGHKHLQRIAFQLRQLID